MKKLLFKMIITMICILMLSPIFLVMLSSLSPENVLFELYGSKSGMGIKTLIHGLTLQHFHQLFASQVLFLKAFLNSAVVCFFIVLGNTVLSIMAAYVFAKISFKGRELIFSLLILIMLLPILVKLVPNFIVLHSFGLNGKLISLILPGVFNPFGVFILKQYMHYVPDEYILSARIDGATYGSCLYHVVVPMSKAGIFSVLAFNLIDSWSMIEQPLVFLNDEKKYPLSLFLFSIEESQMGTGFAASVLFMLPVLFVFFFGRRYLVSGIQLSGLRQ